MEEPPNYFPRTGPSLTPEDFETASIRSAAPSYISDAPTYHSTLPAHTYNTASTSRYPTSHHRAASQPLIPSLNDFRISTWSTTTCNPTARHYHSVAHRRATIANAKEEQEVLQAAMSIDGMKLMRARLEEEEREKLRPLEDPYLVGEEAAERARRERLARENRGNEVLIREDRRWDWLLSQMKDWEEREKSWARFRQEVEGGKRAKLARRMGMGKGKGKA